MTGYTGFSDDLDDQEGNFIALHAEDSESNPIGVRPIGSTAEPAEVDSDGICILKVDADTEGIEFVSGTMVKQFLFDDLTLEPAPEPDPDG